MRNTMNNAAKVPNIVVEFKLERGSRDLGGDLLQADFGSIDQYAWVSHGSHQKDESRTCWGDVWSGGEKESKGELERLEEPSPLERRFGLAK